MARSFCAVIVGPALLGGCALRPLPPEVDSPTLPDLPVFNIVNQIQCEAAAAVIAEHRSRGFTSLSDELEKLTKRVSAASKALNVNKQKLAAKSDFGVREEELEDARTSLSLRGAQIVQALARIETTKAEERVAARLALKSEQGRLLKQTKNLKTAFELFKEGIRLNTIHEALRAELASKRFEKVAAFESHTAAFHFEFEITEDNNLTSTGSVTWPLLLAPWAGTFTMGYDVGDKRQRLTKRTVKLAMSFGELVSSFEKKSKGEKLYCRDVVIPAPDLMPRAYPITGNIGLGLVVKEYLQMLKSGKFKSGGEGYTDKIQFTTTMNGSLKPGIDLARKPSPTVKVSGVAEGIRKDIHSLTISLAPGGDSEKLDAVQQVIITHMPAVRVRPDVLRLPPLN